MCWRLSQAPWPWRPVCSCFRLPFWLPASCPWAFAHQPGGVSKAPQVPLFPLEWPLPGRATGRRKAWQEPCPSHTHPPTPDEPCCNPDPGHTHAEVMQHDREGGWERGHHPQRPAHRGSCQHEGGRPLEARDERAAGWPSGQAGTQDAASSSWTPGSSELFLPSPHPSFLFRRHRELGGCWGQNTHSVVLPPLHVSRITLSDPHAQVPPACLILPAPSWQAGLSGPFRSPPPTMAFKSLTMKPGLSLQLSRPLSPLSCLH